MISVSLSLKIEISERITAFALNFDMFVHKYIHNNSTNETFVIKCNYSAVKEHSFLSSM